MEGLEGKEFLVNDKNDKEEVERGREGKLQAGDAWSRCRVGTGSCVHVAGTSWQL